MADQNRFQNEKMDQDDHKSGDFWVKVGKKVWTGAKWVGGILLAAVVGVLLKGGNKDDNEV